MNAEKESGRLTPKQRDALLLIRSRETSQSIGGPTFADSYTAYVHYRTAESLRAMGLITIGPGPDYEIEHTATYRQGARAMNAEKENGFTDGGTVVMGTQWVTDHGTEHLLDSDGRCWCNPTLLHDQDGPYWKHHDTVPSTVEVRATDA
jgi:hypothetical protein